MPSLGSRRNALVVTVGWWLLRRKLRRRARAAVAGVIAGEGLSLAAPRRQRHRIRNVLLLGALAAGGYVVWKRTQGGHGDDWGTWEPEPPVPEPPAEPAPLQPEPGPVPAAA